MKIEVKCCCENGNCPEWAIFELQGVVEVQPDFQNRIHNLEIGQLCRASSQLAADEKKRLGLLETEKRRAHARFLQVQRTAQSVSYFQ